MWEAHHPVASEAGAHLENERRLSSEEDRDPQVVNGEERRFFIALGSGRYRGLPAEDQLPCVAADIAEMTRLFEGFGYQAVLAGLGQYDSADQIKQKLSHWSRDVALSQSDVVALYFAGHGATVGRDRHYLFCWDSQEDDLAASAIATEDLARILCRGRLNHLLLILDTCAGGAGSADAVTLALQAVAYRQSGDDNSTGLWFLASARRKDTADDGAFVECFCASIAAAVERTGQRQRYVDLSTLVSAVNERFESIRVGQRAELAGGLVTGLAPFIPNAGFREELPPVGTDLEIQRRVADRDLADHFGPRSRGVEYESEQGQYFSGRNRVLSELVSWITAVEADGAGRIITGNPGCGKSAVLGRIVALSNSDYRARIDLSTADLATIIPENSIAVAVHARHKALEEVVTKIAAGLGFDADGPAALLQELSRHERSEPSIVIVVDALDEAGSGTAADAGARGEPRRIARELLRPMSEIATVKLLVGTRRELLTSLGTTFRTLDLDMPTYRADEDVAGYVRQVLLAADEPEILTPYRNMVELAQQIGEGVAHRASGVFLVARMTARSLRSAPLVDTSEPGWIEGLPSEIGAALDDFLARFGSDELRVRRMLLPLAFAEGQGLPRGKIWTRLASELSGVRCTEEDVSWALDVAAPYVSEVTEGAWSVYRLFHQSLAEHLRNVSGRTIEEIQGVVVDALVATVPVHAEAESPDWFAALPYVNQHLATHAAAAGVLDQLVGDPSFLLAANQLALLRALTSTVSEEAWKIRSAYEHVAHRLTSAHPIGDRAADLQLSARRCGADSLAERIDQLGIELPWSARWAWWSTSGAHRVLEGHTKDVLCVATGDLDGRPIAVTGASDRTARIWDLITQRQVGKPLETHVPISAIAVGDLDDYTVALAGGIDGVVQIWDLSSGQQFGEPLEGHTSGIEAIALGVIQGAPVVLTASLDGMARLWNLADRTQLRSPLTAHKRTVRTAALGQINGRPIAVTGGEDKRAYVWDLTGLIDGEPISAPRALIGHAAEVTAVAIAQREGAMVALIGDKAGMLSVWDLSECQQIGQPLSAHRHFQSGYAGILSIAVEETAAIPRILTTGTQDSKLWDLSSLRQYGHPLSGHVGRINGASLIVGPQGSLAVTVSEDRTARIWDLSISQPSAGHTDSVHSLAFAEIDGQPLALTGGTGGTARLWDLRSRSEIGRTLDGHSEDVRSCALGKLNGRLLAVTAGTDTTIRIWDPIQGTSLRILRGHTNAVNQVHLASLNGEDVLVSASEDGTIRLWDPSADTAISLDGHIGGVSRIAVRQTGSSLEIAAITSHNYAYIWQIAADLSVYCEASLDLAEVVAPTSEGLNVAFFGSRPIVLFTREDNGVHAADIRTTKKVGMPLMGHTDIVRYAAFGRIGSQAVVASIAYDQTIRITDLVSGILLQTSFDIQSSFVTGVEFIFGQVDRTPVGITCSPIEVRVWDLRSMLPIGEPLCGGDHDVTGLTIMLVPDAIPDPELVVTSSYKGALRVHSLADGGQVTAHCTSSTYTMSMATASIGRDIFAVQGGWREIRVWDLGVQRRIGTIREPGGIHCLQTYRLDGNWLVISAFEDSTIRIWDLLSCTPFGPPLIGHTARVTDFVTSSAKDLLISASSDGTARIWDLRTHELVGDPLTGHELGVKAVTLGQLGSRDIVITGDGSGYIRAWDLTTRESLNLGIPPNSDAIAQLRMLALNDVPILVIADAIGRIRVWNLGIQTQMMGINVESSIQDMALTETADLCVATDVGVVALKLNLS
jgi:WD40 repeat protein